MKKVKIYPDQSVSYMSASQALEDEGFKEFKIPMNEEVGDFELIVEKNNKYYALNNMYNFNTTIYEIELMEVGSISELSQIHINTTTEELREFLVVDSNIMSFYQLDRLCESITGKENNDIYDHDYKLNEVETLEWGNDIEIGCYCIDIKVIKKNEEDIRQSLIEVINVYSL